MKAEEAGLDSNLVGRTVRDEATEANDVSVEDGDAVKVFCQDSSLHALKG